ncbi:Cl- channel voltage-gated family protein [Thermodesulfatator indicus DSM 15286]|uniref:Cl-channel voltage-gated family protein n=1 Tax=Thermodesulfatator indicus (strain DSM 15286 / JCM 11887 / CIR29812) TaxID=667014 RepID=F8ABM3_THEID|nr:chloride channel protein [Thermodesulfatator indicus]AEH45624.1 Cl- channel voltage-gated family protein [Thermodesulfatator indicus DSM 15286]
MERRRLWLLFDAFFLGIVGAIAAYIFAHLVNLSQEFFLHNLAKYKPPGLPSEGGSLKEWIGPYGLLLIPVVTTLGGLLSGLIVYFFAPEARGHGTDAAIRAFHFKEGRVPHHVPFVKMVASAITLGSGGSAGREGPTAQIGSGIGAIYAHLTKRSPYERRLLLLMGMAAGLSAIFRSPIGCAFFAIEVLYSQIEFESRALLYCIIASVVAYAFSGFFMGWEPLFILPHHIGITQTHEYLFFAVLGIFSGIMGALLPNIFGFIHSYFEKMPGPFFVKPAIGGLLLGLFALFLPQILGIGYGWVQMAINGQLTGDLMLLLAFAKALAFSLTVGSGGSGGDFAPSLYVGGMLGGFVASLFGQDPAAYVVVGMASVFGAAARAPIANSLIVVEITGGFELLPAAALSVMLAYLIQTWLTRFLPYKSLYESQVPSPVHSPAHRGEFFTDILTGIKVKDIFNPHKVWATIPEDMTFRQFLEFFGRSEQHYFPVVDREGNLVGIFSINDIRPFLFNEELKDILLIKDIARKDVITTHPSEDINTVLKKFTLRNIDQLPVVADDDPKKFLGMISRREVIAFYNKRLEELKKQAEET